MKYRVLRDCYGFMGRYWDAGKVVEIPDNLKPPHHFEAVEATKEEVTPQEPPSAKSEEAIVPAAPEPVKKREPAKKKRS
jgi:hypothetical protein